MPEVFYNIYGITGDSRHKKLAELFYHKQILNPLAAQKDSLAGLHVNTQIHKVIGKARGYELTGNVKRRDIASFCCDAVVNHHSYVTGGNSDREILFVASVLDWKEKGITLRQETVYPDKSSTRLIFDGIAGGETNMSVYLRYPSWAVEGVTVKVNGKKQSVHKKPGSYVVLDRVWKQGDVVEMEMPMTLHIEYMPDDSKKGAIMYGPIVLAAELGKKMEGKTSVKVPALTGNPENLISWLKPVDGMPLTFCTAATDCKGKLFLSPLFRCNDQYYTVYFDFK